MNKSAQTDSLVVGGVVLLSAIPLVVGTFRVVELVGSVEITAENARLFAAPIPLTIHIVSALLFCILGAFQFSVHLRRTRSNWHRVGGRIVLPMGFSTALSGLWMTQFYPWAGYDGLALNVIRLLVGTAMVLS